MSDVFYLRFMDPPITPEAVVLPEYAEGCLKLHRVVWKQSFLAADGGRMLCWYTAPDTESARLALRQLESNMDAVWPGTITGNDGGRSPTLSATNCVAELSFNAHPGKDQLDAVTAALTRSGVTFVRGFVSNREPKYVCALQAPDERVVQKALARAEVSADAVWACTPITPPVPAAQG